MTEQLNDIASMLLSDDGENTEPLTESTGAETEIQEIIESQPDDEAVEEESGDDLDEAIDNEDSDETDWQNVNSDGEDLQVTPEEKELGYLRDKDYRKKTMTLAESRRDVEAKAASIDGKLAELDSFIKREEDSTDWEDLKLNDPAEYIERKDALAKTKAAVEKAQSERNQELQLQAKELNDSETAKLIEVMGGDTWTNEQRNVDMKSASEYLTSMGITEEQAAGITSHKMWQIIFDASKAQSFDKTKSTVREQIKAAPKAVKPGQSVPASERKRRSATKRLSSGSSRDRIGALAELL